MFLTNARNESIVRLLVDEFKKLKVGEIFKHIEFVPRLPNGDILNHPVKLNLILRAKKQAEKDGLLFENVRGVGYKRLPADEFTGVVRYTKKRVHRTMNRVIKRVSHAANNPDNGELDNEDVMLLTRELGIAGLLAKESRAKPGFTVVDGRTGEKKRFG